ncbi:coat protein [chicory mosaic cavemovirus]|nr:coat protein [chicory mosaic cavemovirus]
MSSDKEFSTLKIEEHIYKVIEGKLPIDSYIKFPPFTYASFIPYVIYGDTGSVEHKQLNWTNKLLWNKLGQFSSKDKELLQKEVITQKEKELLSYNAKQIINEQLYDRIKYMKEVDQSIDYKIFKIKQDIEKQNFKILENIKELQKEIRNLRKEKEQQPIITGNSYTINMLFEEFLYIEKQKRKELTQQEAISKILENTYKINNNIGLAYDEIKKVKPKTRQIETILDTPAYSRYIEAQKNKKIIKEESDTDEEEYNEYKKWKESKRSKDEPMYIITPNIPPEDKPSSSKNETETTLIQMIEELRKEIKQIKYEKQIAIQEQEITMIKEEELDPDNLDPEQKIIEKLDICKLEEQNNSSDIDSDMSIIEEEILTENCSDTDNENYINIKIEDEEFQDSDNRNYKKHNPEYYTNIRKQRWKSQNQNRSSKQYINNRREQFEKTYKSNMDTNISGNGEILNLDCTTPDEAEERIQKWVQVMSIAIVKQNLSNEDTKKFIARTFIGNVKEWYARLTNESKEKMNGTTPLQSLQNHEYTIRAEFGRLGIESELDKQEFMKKAARINLLQLQICSMDHKNLKAYICEFQEYFYSAAYTQEESSGILDQLYLKLPEPWGKLILENYNKIKPTVNLDSIGTRITYLHQSIKDRCTEYWLTKQADKLRKQQKYQNKLDCNYYEVGKYGCNTSYKKPYKKKKYIRKYKPIKRKSYTPTKYKKYYRPKKFMKRKTYNKKQCTCFNCGEEGHKSYQCKKPKNIKERIINNLVCYEIDSEELEDREFIIEPEDIIYILEYEGEYEKFEDENTLSDTEYWYESDNQIYMLRIEDDNENEQNNDMSLEKYEDNTGKINKVIFTQEKFQKIIQKDLDITKQDIFGNKGIKDIFNKSNIEYYIITDLEEPIDVKYTQNNLESQSIKLPLYDPKIFEQEIEKIPDKNKNKIKNIHLAAIEIIIKGYFKEGINTPLELILCDDRITYPKEGCIIATYVGNLIYQQIKFKQILNYSISVQDKNMKKSLVLYWNLKGIEMTPGSKIFSVRIRHVYVLSEKHIIKNKKIYKNNVIIEPIFEDIIQPNDRRIIEFSKPEKELQRHKMRSYSKKFKEIPVIEDKPEPSRRSLLIPEGNNNRILDIPKIKQRNINNNQYHIIGKIGTKYYPILIDTGAANSYISSKIITEQKITTNNLQNMIKTKNYKNQENIYDKEAILKIKIKDVRNQEKTLTIKGLVETIPLLELGETQVLIGMDILQELTPYSLNEGYLELTINYEPVRIFRIKEHIHEIVKNLEILNE